ncbi:hypothetical protein [Acinetobacter cumulans]|uniref:hypothetical protein n=1 Tax=Acinetobacter cumulans TaxID=2136182 RepID=UPI00148BBEC6|nr:hypothetical protein [Acinetobacter cumulans]
MRVSQHTAQASSKAPFGTQLYLVDIGKLNTPRTIQIDGKSQDERPHPSYHDLASQYDGCAMVYLW